jgi:hypothetical protein
MTTILKEKKIIFLKIIFSYIKIKDIYKIVSQHNEVSEPQQKSKPDFVDLTKETESNNKKSGCSACN